MTYRNPRLRGRGESSASQTAWALMGLLAAGEVRLAAVRRAVEFLTSTQLEDGSWDEPYFSGTGFPGTFYLRYDLYRIYYPLIALARFLRLSES